MNVRPPPSTVSGPFTATGCQALPHLSHRASAQQPCRSRRPRCSTAGAAVLWGRLRVRKATKRSAEKRAATKSLRTPRRARRAAAGGAPNLGPYRARCRAPGSRPRGCPREGAPSHPRFPAMVSTTAAALGACDAAAARSCRRAVQRTSGIWPAYSSRGPRLHCEHMTRSEYVCVVCALQVACAACTEYSCYSRHSVAVSMRRPALGEPRHVAFGENHLIFGKVREFYSVITARQVPIPKRDRVPTSYAIASLTAIPSLDVTNHADASQSSPGLALSDWLQQALKVRYEPLPRRGPPTMADPGKMAP